MQTLIHHTRKFLTDDEGATMAEYVVLMAVIVIGVIGAIATFKDSLLGAFGKVEGEVKDASAGN